MPCPPMGSRRWLVWKFGGTSVADADRITHVARLIDDRCNVSSLTFPYSQETRNRVSFGSEYDAFLLQRQPYDTPSSRYRLAVVVSALAGVTDALTSTCLEAAAEFHANQRVLQTTPLSKTFSDVATIKGSSSIGNELHGFETTRAAALLREIEERHLHVIATLQERGEVELTGAEFFKKQLTAELQDISRMLHAFSLTGYCPSEVKEVILGYGELWSSRLVYLVVSKRFIMAQRVCGQQQQQQHAGSLPASSTSSVFMTTTRRNDYKHGASADRELLRLTSPRRQCQFCMEDDTGHTSCCQTSVRWLDARKILIAQSFEEFGAHQERVTIDFEASGKLMEEWLFHHPECSVVITTGYICSLPSGCPSTLKRNGSDYSGSLFSALLQATLYTVWTDVDGIYTADPRIVSTATRLPFLSYLEAIELAYFGAKVLHPLTMQPCIKRNIPIVLRSSFQPQRPGTLVFSAEPERDVAHSRTSSKTTTDLQCATEDTARETSRLTLAPVGKATPGHCRAFSLIDRMTLISVTGSSLLGVSGIASRVFGAVHEARCSVTMVSQASSEHSICFAVPSPATPRAKSAVESAFYRELQDKTMRVLLTPDCSLICAVGEGMCGGTGVLGKLAAALGAARINIIAVAQGCSELNITFVVRTHEARRALQAVHHAAFGRNDARHRETACVGSYMTLLVTDVSTIEADDVQPTSRLLGYTDGSGFRPTSVGRDILGQFVVTPEDLIRIAPLIVPPILLVDARETRADGVNSGSTMTACQRSSTAVSDGDRGCSTSTASEEFLKLWRDSGHVVLGTSDLHVLESLVPVTTSLTSRALSPNTPSSHKLRD